jgi:large subunit ribosomal protein L13
LGCPNIGLESTMSTVFAKPAEVRADWFVVDAQGKTLGRLATQLAHRLKGKHKADYSPHVDMGDNLIVLNAGKVHVTGAKLTDKIYYRHMGFVGNLKSIALGKLLQEHPERALQFAVKGMLPKNTLGRKMFRKLHVFAGNEHPHTAQQPKALEI